MYIEVPPFILLIRSVLMELSSVILISASQLLDFRCVTFSAKTGTKLSAVLICSSMALSFHFWFFNPGSIPLMLRRKKEGGVTCSCLDDGEVGGGFAIGGDFALEV